MNDYKILRAEWLDELEEKVNYHYPLGYVPIGGVTAITTSSGVKYLQAVENRST